MSKAEKVGDSWETPRWLFDRLDQEFHFGLDVAATSDNTKTEVFCSEGRAGDGLVVFWGDALLEGRGAIWCNPPYSYPGPWVKKAIEEARRGATVVMLLPAATDTNWWRDFVLKADEIRFMTGRLKFEYQGKPAQPARMGSAIVIFRPPVEEVRGFLGRFFLRDHIKKPQSVPRFVWVDYRAARFKPEAEGGG